MAHLETLPNELFMIIFGNLSSPLHIWAFVKASPVALGHLASYRQRCISTTIDQLEAWLQTHPQAVMVCRLQHIQRKDSYLEPSKIKSAAWSILNSRPVMDSSIRQSSLRFLSELFILQIHVNEVALTYASQAWNVLQSEAEAYEDRINRPHPPRVPFTPSSTELLRIEQGYLEFEVKRHSFHYVKPGLNLTGETLASRWRSSIRGPFYAGLNSEKGAPYSIFRYLSNERKSGGGQDYKTNVSKHDFQEYVDVL
ncbi:hypothetical protein NM208_g5734 [Fusarium decemcellulare]|uniref:Uncharacterized protein n=1 Tax=Fusarium decemcellulare TaxID=57161 RepID=A0ACC1SFX3_9HYPO|nr:hypothetical protein NM208_g5734 [Fusarium decemcellulare]